MNKDPSHYQIGTAQLLVYSISRVQRTKVLLGSQI